MGATPRWPLAGPGSCRAGRGARGAAAQPVGPAAATHALGFRGGGVPAGGVACELNGPWVPHVTGAGSFFAGRSPPQCVSFPPHWTVSGQETAGHTFHTVLKMSSA